MLWSDVPPEPRTRDSNRPTILFSWWCTIFSALIILFRLCGRKVRTNKLFREDWIIFMSLVPLFLRMGLVQVILLYGTNNVKSEGLDAQQLHDRVIGSKLVLAARIFFAMFIWISKWTVSEFLKRIFYGSWNKNYELILRGIRIFLVVTFIVVVISTLSECQPFDHYWQVIPDPGPQCRQGFANLISMGVADIITDILLVVFPVFLVIKSNLTLLHKFNLVVLFSFSLILIAITGARVPQVIAKLGRQQYRSVWASIEILVSTFVSNMLVLGGFVADRGIKKNKYRHGSFLDSLERQSTRRPTLITHDSDEDLFRSIGCRMPQELKGEEGEAASLTMRPAPVFLPDHPPEKSTEPLIKNHLQKMAPLGATEARESTHELAAWLRGSARDDVDSSVSPLTKPDRMDLSDPGGLLGDDLADARGRSPHTTRSHDFATSPPTYVQARGMLAPLGGILSHSPLRSGSHGRSSSGARTPLSSSSRLPPSPRGSPRIAVHRPDSMDLQDAGGLLS